MRRIATTLTALALVLAGCSAASGSPAESAAEEGGDPASLDGTTWLLVEIGGETPPELSASTLVFGEDGTVSGLAGCNNFNGSAELGEGTITFGPLATTRMACTDEGLAQLETDYLGALEGAETWALTGDELVIGGDTELRFGPG